MKDLRLPKIRCIEQEILTPHIKNLESVLRDKIQKFQLKDLINQGDNVALTASSRGIKDQYLILKFLVKYIKDLNANPFIIPAMGSHGGGTAQGQLTILEEYGITEQTMECPIKSSMEVISIGQNEFGTPIFVDNFVAQADKIILLNKIKTHSKFVGNVESGLSKMLLIGLGKHHGAKIYHRLIEQYSWSEIINSLRNEILNRLPIILGIAIVQNAFNQTAEIHFLTPDKFETKEPNLLKRYKDISPKLPFRDIDLLIVDEMGKNIFGTGMDTNITGRKSDSTMKVKWIFIRDLTFETHGNAQGIGLADFTTDKLVDKIDLKQTYENALTAYRTDSPKIPIHFPSDREVLRKIIDIVGSNESMNLKIVWIKNTLELRKLLISKAYDDEVDNKKELRFIGNSEKFKFSENGFLLNSIDYW
ncbi:MAG: DUF2088 domain-containing protein [Candidatus Lokiarchaeota archaeon]|nr:DUF2088 domain-containing protein [Candidatus Lokiarchaeota archaeon]MBD3199974.1 DUF2088 domain-containing protein [Candidatus Lokiarchaeota archaeon]